MPIGSSQGITLPTQGANTDTWGTDLNTELQKLINSVEAQVPSSAIDYAATVDFNTQATENIAHIKFRTANGTGNGVRSLYSSGGELYYIDGTGTTVQLTSNGTLNFGSVGGIGDSGGTYGTSGIEVDWNGTQYDFHDGAANYAPVRLDSVAFEDATFFITMNAPTLSASYSITLPASAPTESRPIVMSSAGALTAATEIDVEGDVYHGEQELHIPLTVMAQSGSDYVFSANGTAAPSISFNAGGGAGNFVLFDVPTVRTDDRIIGLEVDVTGISTTASFRLQLFQGSTQIGSNGDVSGTADQTLSIGATTTRITASFGPLWIKIDKIVSGAVTIDIEKIRLTIDRTKP